LSTNTHFLTPALANVDQRIKQRARRLQNLRIRQVVLLIALQVAVFFIQVNPGNRLLLFGQLRTTLSFVALLVFSDAVVLPTVLTSDA